MNLRAWWRRRLRGHTRHGQFHIGPAAECARCEADRNVVHLSTVRHQYEQRRTDKDRRHG